jgi:thiol-disulfide isomerase/thioredoxin
MTKPHSKRRAALIALAALSAGAAGLGAQRWLRSGPQAVPAVNVLFGLQLPDLQGRPQAFNQWRGRLLLANFWATWCEPCREEVPALVRLHEKSAGTSLQVVGISVDSAANVRDFADKFRISYPLVIGGLESIDLVRELGNRSGGLPFTVLLGTSGTLLATHIGAMNDQGLSQFVHPHLS